MTAGHPRWGRFVVLVATTALLAGCGGDDGAGAGSTGGDRPSATGSEPAADWQASPGQLEAVTQTLTARRYDCTDMDGGQFTFRACAGRRQTTSGGRTDRSRRTVKLVAAQDGTVVQVGIDADEELLTAVGPQLFGPADTAVLKADGTNLQWGSFSDRELGGYERRLVGRIKGLSRPPTPPSGPLPLTKERLLVEISKSPSWDCEIDDGRGSPAPRDRSRVDIGPTLDCHDKTLPGDHDSAGVEFADGGDGIDDLELRGSHASQPPGAVLKSRLEPVWAGLGTDLANVRATVDRYLAAGVETVGYVDGWKIVVRQWTEVDREDSSTVVGQTIRVRILRERPDLLDPKPAR